MSEGKTDSFKLQQAYQSRTIFPTLHKFSMSQIISYFVEVIAEDLDLKRDFKSLRESSFQMFRAGHIQDIYMNTAHNNVVITASCLP